MATFNNTTKKDALPLTTGEKYQLFFKSAIDPEKCVREILLRIHLDRWENK